MDIETMSAAAIQARREYKRKWNAANPEKVKAAQKRYWERQAAKMAEAEKQPTEGVS